MQNKTLNRIIADEEVRRNKSLIVVQQNINDASVASHSSSFMTLFNKFV